MPKAVSFVAIAALLTSTAPTAWAAQPYELPNVLVVSKSTNRNEVHYGAYVDAACMPTTNAPLHPYWLMRERGPNAVEGLSRRELAVLGVARQEVAGDTIRFVVAGLPTRGFAARVGRDAGGACTSSVETTIGGAQARVLAIHVKVHLFGVDYVLLRGQTAEGKLVEERVRPS
jgi:hypothetical protein